MNAAKLANRFIAGNGGPGRASMGNGTDQLDLADLPANILETFIPGYSIISRTISERFGFDITALVFTFALVLAGVKAVTYLWSILESNFTKYCMSSVHIDNSDDLYDNILKWIAEQRMSRVARSLKAKSPRGSTWDEDADETGSADAAIDSEGNFNYGHWQARVPPRYEPYYGRHRFWHKGHYFVFHRSQKQKQVIQGPWGSGGQDDDLVELSCVGFTTGPVKALLEEIKTWSVRKQLSRTIIRNPTGKDRGRYAGAWSKTSSRPSRPMATVILDDQQKSMIIRDMNEFLHPASPKWYATRGIPYRRGYLFHGPPGTGKTSLSFALAGIFGLEIYCIALNDPELTESDLIALFNGLPRRCIVLLEDIDEAGVKRKDNSGGNDAKSKKKDKPTEGGDKDGSNVSKTDDRTDDKKKEGGKDDATNWTLQDLARAIMSVSNESTGRPSASAQPPGRRGKRNETPGMPAVANMGISLSGLLNAIDGVATHEGRILIMTTNHPEKLDAALIRSGRVDLQIRFTFAKRPQIEELFMRMYAADIDSSAQLLDLDLGLSGNTKTNGHHEKTNGQPASTHDVGQVTTVAMDELEAIASAFAAKLPDEGFPPADIQGFLLLYKKQPRMALEKVEDWRDEELKKRAEKLAQEEED